MAIFRRPLRERQIHAKGPFRATCKNPKMNWDRIAFRAPCASLPRVQVLHTCLPNRDSLEHLSTGQRIFKSCALIRGAPQEIRSCLFQADDGSWVFIHGQFPGSHCRLFLHGHWRVGDDQRETASIFFGKRRPKDRHDQAQMRKILLRSSAA